jgi:hypothetical protein
MRSILAKRTFTMPMPKRRKMNRTMHSKTRIGLCALLLLCFGGLSCSGALFQNYGRIHPGDETSGELENGMVDSGLRYYISGSDLYPNALIGLHRDQRLDPETLWKEVKMTPAKLRQIVGFMKAKAFEYREFPHRFDLLDTGGKKIGFWYSILSARTYIHFAGDGIVTIGTPDLDTYEKFARDVETE